MSFVLLLLLTRFEYFSNSITDAQGMQYVDCLVKFVSKLN